MAWTKKIPPPGYYWAYVPFWVKPLPVRYYTGLLTHIPRVDVPGIKETLDPDEVLYWWDEPIPEPPEWPEGLGGIEVGHIEETPEED